MHGRVLPEGRRLPYPEAHADVEEDHDGHRDDEEEQGGELEEERRGRLGRGGKKDIYLADSEEKYGKNAENIREISGIRPRMVW